MSYQILKKDPFYIIGIATRTQNRNDQAKNDIHALWGRFFAENIMEKIPKHLGGEIYNLYLEYESDQNGPYTVVVGCPVEDIDFVPEGMKGVKVEGGDFAIYKPKGVLPKIVFDTWQEIYNETAYQRSFKNDFDIYGKKTENPQDAQPVICVGINDVET